MRKIVALFALFIVLTFSAIAFEAEGDTMLAEEMPEYNGYIVSVKNGFADGTLSGEVALFSEGELFSELSDEEFVEFLDENVAGTSTIIEEIGMMKVDDEETLQMLKDSGLVVSYEPDYVMHLMGYDYENEPAFSYQWGHKAIKSYYPWQAGIFGRGVRVAVIDSGVYPHRDLAGHIEKGRNYVYGMDSNDTTDNHGHGTFVAGIIAAQCNGYDTLGLAHGATIVPFKVTDTGSIYMSTAILAMYDAVKEFDCDVINMSLGAEKTSTELERAVNYVVRDSGAILVAAAGNGNSSAYSYPASYDCVISVANAEKTADGYKIRYSSQRNDMVDVAAPGTDVYSLENSSSGYKFWTGTSFACPYVSAAAALAKSVIPSINQEQFNKFLERSSDTSYITESQDANYWGHGLLDVEKFIKLVLYEHNYGETQTDFYVSPPETEDSTGNTSVYITSVPVHTVPLTKAMFVAYNYLTNSSGATRLNRIKIIPVQLTPYGSKEISLTNLGFAGEVKYSLISENLSPLIHPVRSFTQDNSNNA